MLDIIILIIIMIITLLISAFFAAAEVSLVSMSKLRARTLLKSNQIGSQSLDKLKKNQRSALVTILIGNNLVNIFASALATVISMQLFGELGVGIAIAVMSVIIIMFGDIFPKTFASSNSDSTALFSAPILEIMVMLASPLLKVINAITEFTFRSFKKDSIPIITEKEIRDIIAIGVEEKAIKHQEKELIERVFQFNDIPVKSIMVPREKLVPIPSTSTVAEALEISNQHTHFRFPVVSPDKKIIGTIRLRDLLKYVKKEDNKLITEIMLTPFFISEDSMIDQVFRDMREKKFHIGYVVDRVGEPIGLVTIADIVEELVGDVDI